MYLTVSPGLFAAALLSLLGTSAVSAQARGGSPHGALDIPCATCHSPESWSPARIAKSFDHGRFGFPLDGGHGSVTCASCHQSLDFGTVATTCASCHQDIHRGELGVECAQCHTTRSFNDRAQQINHSQTRFPLEGAHRTLDCQACHAPGQNGTLSFRGAPTSCLACHRAAFETTVEPNHVAAGFPADCTGCHNKATWQGSSFDHDLSDFALTGGHQAVTCQACHADKVYAGKSTACISCHQATFEQTTTPPHQAARFDQNCQSCHTTAAWSGATYDHNLTRFPLTGAHQPLTCDGCHATDQYVGLPMTCSSCHQARFDQTAAPPHRAAGFPVECATCHTTVTWTGARFDHGTTRFPLTGAHGAVSCGTCHADGVYTGKSATCVACHQSDFDGATNPNHKAGGLPTDCASCHTTATWDGAKFDHSLSQFPLTGAHLAATCQSCHADGVFNGKPTTCVSCHQPDYDKTTDPNHRAAGFVVECQTCHTTSVWDGAKFDHSLSQFPLTGAHLAATCRSCHADGVFDGKPTTCVSCHQPDYDQTANPNHGAAGFPATCATCHSTVAWAGATFNHGATAFPLTGAHLAETCQACHADGVYRGKPTACVACHQVDYTTADPSHQAAKFPTTCGTCHTTATWQGGTFDHAATSFPLTGAHVAAICKDCHADNVFDGKATTCVSCHQSDYDGTTNPIHKAAGFPTDCLSCHTTVRWDGATFDHDGKYFRIYSGKHRTEWTTCATCHTNPADFKQFTCLTCHTQKDMDDHHKSEPGYSYSSPVCLSCHPDV